MVSLRPLTPDDLTAYESLYEQSFPPSERKDMAFMTSGQYAYAYDLWVVSTPCVSVAGMVVVVKHENYAMLDYLAISPYLRGQGIGHDVLPLVREKYQDTCLFLEIESPTPHAPNLQERLRRRDFYVSCGLVPCGVHAYIYDTDMELWAYPESAPRVSFEMYAKLIASCFPKDMQPQAT